MAESRYAMRWSLIVGFLMLIGKMGAYFYTGSPAIFSDAIESVIHVIAVGFAAFSMQLSFRPTNSRHLYGYERIAFMSAGFEGALIIIAAVMIIYSAVEKWLSGLVISNLGVGTLIVLAASLVNAGLGWYLIRTGRRHGSIILEANGKHVLTDSWTSFGVVGGLCLVLLTGWKPFDPILAIAVALNILWSGGHLVWRAATGLLDYADPEKGKQLREKLDQLCGELEVQYHGVRFRETGQRTIVTVDLLFPYEMQVGEAHRRATLLEERLPELLDFQVEVSTHLESMEDHAKVHKHEHYTGLPS